MVAFFSYLDALQIRYFFGHISTKTKKNEKIQSEIQFYFKSYLIKKEYSDTRTIFKYIHLTFLGFFSEIFSIFFIKKFVIIFKNCFNFYLKLKYQVSILKQLLPTQYSIFLKLFNNSNVLPQFFLYFFCYFFGYFFGFILLPSQPASITNNKITAQLAATNAIFIVFM